MSGHPAMRSGCLAAFLLATVGLPGQNASFAPFGTQPLAGGMVHDPDRNVVVVFAARSSEVWEWDGLQFRARLGVSHTTGSGGVWDPVRHRILTPDGGCWDGAHWTYTSIPTGWNLGAMAFDARRQKLVRLFPPGEVAEWDGGQWQRITPPASPGPGGAFAWDPTLARCVLAVGDPLTLWTWDGSQWELLDQGGPPGITVHGIVSDPAGRRLVLHGVTASPFVPVTWAFAGGTWRAIATPPSLSTVRASLCWDGSGLLRLGARDPLPEGLWRLEGDQWRQLPDRHPPLRDAAALASTPARSGILLFGGRTGSNAPPLDDTWIFAGAWTRLQPAHVPPPRRSAGLAWSPVNQAFVLSGGIDAQNARLTDTWLWNGNDWLRQTPATAPPGDLQLVTDPAGGVLGLFPSTTGATNRQWQWNGTGWANTLGPGAAYTGAPIATGHDPRRNVVAAAVGYELWEWDGAAWTARGALPSGAPGSVVYRPDTQRMLFGGAGPVEWDGTTWFPVNLGFQPFGNAPVLAPDFDRSRVFSFQHQQTPYGSSIWNGVSAWLTPTPASAVRFGYGCALGPAPGLTSDGRPWPGEADFGIHAAMLAPRAPCLIAIGLVEQPQHLGAGCVLWLGPPLAVHFLATDPAGRARAGIAIPNDPRLRGVTVLAQAVAFDPQRGPYAGLTFSEGLRLTVGD